MSAAEFSRSVVLSGERVRLEPLGPEHVEGLQAVVAEGDLWRTWYTSIPAPDAVEEEVERRLDLQADHAMAPWALRRLDTGAVCGVTTYMNLDPVNGRVEIGSTWLAPSAQGTGVNVEAKLLLFTRAFEDLGCIAVELRTHWHNHQSRTAIARLGAKQDGVLRNHARWPDGSLRDTVVFSVLDSEWPAVRSGLRHRLRPRPPR
ncbi:GNAT family N-acetyltransferase [Kineococcus rubinsiae]|uniref:GNAT family N-acetyltransferase n=1 Tax=Kineococcus rubinsiae TaxID=2609562 RepID=UPI0014303745|nr:GNAT family protein [Kineococcus rubinsiae]NIZ93376.1 GNAT family N-acetyltransferase [Kineococcus rubinsiae]